MIDGVHFAEHVVLAAVGVNERGDKQVLGLREGATADAVRAAIAAGTFAEFRREFVANYVPTKKVLLARAADAER